jgi:hypothetical protein
MNGKTKHQTEMAWSKLWPQVLIGVLSAVGGYWFHALQENRSNDIKRLEAQLNGAYTKQRAELNG